MLRQRVPLQRQPLLIQRRLAPLCGHFGAFIGILEDFSTLPHLPGLLQPIPGELDEP